MVWTVARNEDHEAALPAIRNFNGVDVGGRPLRMDLAASDPFLEGKTTNNGEIVGDPSEQPRSKSNIGPPPLPAGTPVPPGRTAIDMIKSVVATTRDNQMMEVLTAMKVRRLLMKGKTINHPNSGIS